MSIRAELRKLRKLVAPDDDGRCPECRERTDLDGFIFVHLGVPSRPFPESCAACGRGPGFISFVAQDPNSPRPFMQWVARPQLTEAT